MISDIVAGNAGFIAVPYNHFIVFSDYFICLPKIDKLLAPIFALAASKRSVDSCFA